MNNKNSLLLVDPEFDPQVASDCSLLLKIMTDSYSYAVINKKINQPLVIFDHQECDNVMAELSNRRQTDPYLSLGFGEVKIAVHTSDTIFIPQDLYQSSDIDTYKQFFSNEVTTVYSKAINNYGLQLVFAPESSADLQLDDLFPHADKYDQTAAILHLTAALNGTILLLDFTVSSCNIVYRKDGQLIFSNYFETDDAGEFHYYLVLLLKQLDIDAHSTAVYLSGIIHEQDEKYTCIIRYFKDIQFLNYFKDEEYDLLDDMPAHYYNSLLALDLCES